MNRLFRREQDHRVGFAELFYDLVFVFAVTQVSHYLLSHYTLQGAAEATVLFLAVWWSWMHTTWALNRLDPDRSAVRGLLFALMAVGLYLSMAIPAAFAGRGGVFALALVAMSGGRGLFLLAVTGSAPALRRTMLRVLVWIAAAAVLWLAGAAAPPEARLGLWAAALAIDYAGPALGFAVPGLGRDASADWQVSGPHMAERCGLFVIICLGELLLVSGATFAGAEWTAAGHGAFLASAAGSVGMWWVYFHIGHRRGSHHIAHAANPGRVARRSFTYLHIPIVAGIVLSAVGAERAIAAPQAAATLADAGALVGGVAAFLAGNAGFKLTSGGSVQFSHIAGLALCLALAVQAGSFSLAALSAAASAVLAVVALWEDRVARRRRARLMRGR